jgi:hypothetical protein
VSKEPIEIVEPTEEERRNIFKDMRAQTLKPDQQLVIDKLEDCMRAVGELGPGTASCDVNPMFRHPYQRSAMRALDLAHSECLNWFDRANRGFDPVLPKDPPAEPEKQE